MASAWKTSLRLGGLLIAVALMACAPLWAGARSGDTALPEGLVVVDPPVPMPAFGLEDIQGESVRSTDLQGKVAIIRFWATW